MRETPRRRDWGCSHRGQDRHGFQAVPAFGRAGRCRSSSNLGFMYREGLGVARDDAEAAKWYLKAVEQGEAEAQNIVGVMYANGQGFPQDHAKAMKWYRKP